MPICKDCNSDKKIEEMVKRPDRIPYYRNLCKSCKSLRNQTDSIKQLNKEYFEKNKITIYSKRQLRKQNNINERLADSVRARLRAALKGNYKTGMALQELGCTISVLKQHLSAKFEQGMSWDNYGKWHMDHIRPLSAFDLSDAEQINVACNYSNIQPLWAKDNLMKGSKI
jgi:putative ubiquitin-RnfH superfamily antitoxin RatB of RatAB toxin-antitoxin module